MEPVQILVELPKVALIRLAGHDIGRSRERLPLAVFDEQVCERSSRRIKPQLVEIVLDEISSGSSGCGEFLLVGRTARNDVINAISERGHIARDECELDPLESAVAVTFGIQKLDRNNLGVWIAQKEIHDACLCKTNVSIDKIGSCPSKRIKQHQWNTIAPRINLREHGIGAQFD